MAQTDLPAVCIVGRPNVGKSTLFNRMIGRRRAVVHDASGTTRDSVEEVFELDGKRFRLIDTGGLIKDAGDRIEALVKQQIKRAMEEAGMFLFVCDASAGVMPRDEEIALLLRKSGKRIFLVANKADNEALRDASYDLCRLGLGNPYPVSAMHNTGVSALMDEVAAAIAGQAPPEQPAVACRIAVTGRPNVGKSLFLNTLLEKDRVIVDDTPGTTRDSIDTFFRKEGELYQLIDTAGIRHKRKVKEPIDVYSMSRSREAIERSDAALLIIDGYDGLRNDDVRIFNFIRKSGTCCIIVVNKWDLVSGVEMSGYAGRMMRKAPDMSDYPVIFASAKTSRNVLACIDAVKPAVANADTAIETGELNKFAVELKQGAPGFSRKPLRVFYMVQTSTRPPSFLLFVNEVKRVSAEYTRFLEKMLRKRYGLYGTPVRIRFRRRK